MKPLIGNPNMRHFAAVVLFAAALPLYAQERPKFEPAPAPPPEPGFNFDSAVDAPTVNIRRGDIQQTEERASIVDGKKTVTVTSPAGTVYELREDIGDGAPTRSRLGDSGLRVPLWQIYPF
jgi:hypothetical protein